MNLRRFVDIETLGPGLELVVPDYAKFKAAYEVLGWFGNCVWEPTSPNGFNFNTSGIKANFGHPDFQICIPTDSKGCHDIIKILVDRITHGEKFETGIKLYDGILGNGYHLAFMKALENGREVLRLLIPNPEGGYDGQLYQAQFDTSGHAPFACTCADCTQAGMKAHPCQDCGIDTTAKGLEDDNYYMVTNKIWKRYSKGALFLCLDCLEKRMGRKLKAQDFTDTILNTIMNERVRALKNPG